ncbi:PLP-dependent transferase [Aspergillus aculeatinus CBS 121060]|uniref:PLP-dependent transferase n=1 Tax=Aspergillus aculeatinus CBS 121060 TaxID=1448322 RepID=A0ACD1H904_9EURO|nr:PLP-dependent transferase [Aspergillus aculeatinus CBS 121060]RAH69892.1 PLP-dependent transferase [Aspergillus aculeatinus CBS 121060]
MEEEIMRALNDVVSRRKVRYNGASYLCFTPFILRVGNLGARIQTLNLGSYNYLGFAQFKGTCADQVEATIRPYGVSAGGARADIGGLDLHIEVEQLVAGFVRKEASIALEERLREAISQGQPATTTDPGSSGGYRPWRKILVVVDLKGTFCNLPDITALKRGYTFHLEVDILMGNLTKSFGAIGGYIAADGETVRKLRAVNAGVLYSEAIAPALLAQISASFRILTGELLPGQKEERLQRLAFNSRYLRLGLKRLGLIVYGNDDSPVIPLILYNPGKMPAFSQMMLARGISVVVVPFPAVPLELCRVRFCVSAAHNLEDLNRVLAACDEIGDILRLKFSSGVGGGLRSITKPLSDGNPVPPRWKLDDVVRCGAQDVQQPLY